MGFIAGCILLALLIKVAWDFFTKPDERGKMLQTLVSRPLHSAFMIVWMAFFLMFFLGIFVPPLGEMEITGGGWQIWQIGILGFFGMWIATWFLDIDKMDKQ